MLLLKKRLISELILLNDNKEKSYKKAQNKPRNLGLVVCRSVMCFLVIICHFWRNDTEVSNLQFLYWIREYAVSVFVFMSFFLTKRIYVLLDKKRFANRVLNLVWCQVMWSVVYFAFYKVYDLVMKTENVSLMDLFFQIVFGHSSKLNPTMWYHFDLIIISLGIYILMLYSKKHYKIVMVLIVTSAFFAQYSRINYSFFSRFRFEISYPMGRIAELIPVALFAFCAETWIRNSERIMEKHRIALQITILLAVILIFLFFPKIQKDDFGYAGIDNLVVSFLVFLWFYLMQIKSVRTAQLVSVLGNYTLGIYCMHRLVNRLLILVVKEVFAINFKTDTLVYCAVNYLCCYFICFVISRLNASKRVSMLIG